MKRLVYDVCLPLFFDSMFCINSVFIFTFIVTIKFTQSNMYIYIYIIINNLDLLDYVSFWNSQLQLKFFMYITGMGRSIQHKNYLFRQHNILSSPYSTRIIHLTPRGHNRDGWNPTRGRIRFTAHDDSDRCLRFLLDCSCKCGNLSVLLRSQEEQQWW